jgi:hypothetical protein
VYAGCTLLLAPVPALAHPNDARATRAYLRARETYVSDEAAGLDASIGAIDADEQELAGACPFALTYAPRDAAFEELGDEARTTLLDAGAAITHGARLAFARALDRIRWGDPRLTRLARRLAAEELTPATIVPSDVCADIRAWEASAYTTLPQSTSEFLARSGRGEPGSLASLLLLFEEPPDVKIARLLRRLESPREIRMALRIERQEQETSIELGTASRTAAARLAAAVGITAL